MNDKELIARSQRLRRKVTELLARHRALCAHRQALFDRIQSDRFQFDRFQSDRTQDAAGKPCRPDGDRPEQSRKPETDLEKPA